MRLTMSMAMMVVAMGALARGEAVPRTHCFAVERLPAELRAKSDALLLRILDSEAIYTVIGGLKPWSGSTPTLSFKVEEPDLKAVEETRQMMEAWSCGGGVEFGLHHYARVFGTAEDAKKKTPPRRMMAGVVFHREAMGRLIGRYPGFFSPLGLTPNADPMEVLMAVEYMDTAERFRGYGLLFGYPEAAVKFFVENTPIPQGRNTDPNKPVVVESVKPSPRKFISIPTVARETGAFVYAVAADHVEDEADRELRERAKPILESYKRRRALYIGDGKAGAAALLRDWFCRGEYDCQASNAVLDPVVEKK